MNTIVKAPSRGPQGFKFEWVQYGYRVRVGHPCCHLVDIMFRISERGDNRLPSIMPQAWAGVEYTESGTVGFHGSGTPVGSVTRAVHSVPAAPNPSVTFLWSTQLEPMSDPRNFPYRSEAGLEPYHDDPTMSSVRYDDPRSPALNSPRAHDPDATQPPLVSIRSTVPLIPTPGTVSKRHPTYVCYRLFPDERPRSVDPPLRRNQSYCASGL
jgi:hypothetical protein